LGIKVNTTKLFSDENPRSTEVAFKKSGQTMRMDWQNKWTAMMGSFSASQ